MTATSPLGDASVIADEEEGGKKEEKDAARHKTKNRVPAPSSHRAEKDWNGRFNYSIKLAV